MYEQVSIKFLYECMVQLSSWKEEKVPGPTRSQPDIHHLGQNPAIAGLPNPVSQAARGRVVQQNHLDSQLKKCQTYVIHLSTVIHKTHHLSFLRLFVLFLIQSRFPLLPRILPHLCYHQHHIKMTSNSTQGLRIVVGGDDGTSPSSTP
jgi:hypothetical protein